MLGYTKKLYILPFDHRGSYLKYLFGKRTVGVSERKQAEDYKKIIFEGFLKAWDKLPAEAKDERAVFLDNKFCFDIIHRARKKAVCFALAVEESGNEVFNFEEGKNFGQVILTNKPNFVKALVRYVRGSASGKQELQFSRLKQLNDWCRAKDYKLIIELLVPPPKGESKRIGNKRKFDQEVRPGLTIRTVKDFYRHGIEPDIWKIEAMEKGSDWDTVIAAIRPGEAKKNIGIIMLGRGASFARVKQWIGACPKDKINGFAVGRTVWLRPLLDLRDGRINKKQAVEQIARNFEELTEWGERG